MAMATKTCISVYLFILVFALARAANSDRKFMKERRVILKLCRDVTKSDELQLSFECAERMKISSMKDKHIETSQFMGILQRVQRKVNAGLDLDKPEKMLWEIVREKLRAMTARSMTKYAFVRKADSAPACMIVRCLRKKYGFCTYLGLLGERRYKDWGKFHVVRELRRSQKKKLKQRLDYIRRKMQKKKEETRRRIRRKAQDTQEEIKEIQKKIAANIKIIHALRKDLKNVKQQQRKIRHKINVTNQKRKQINRQWRYRKSNNHRLIESHKNVISLLREEYSLEADIAPLNTQMKHIREENAHYKQSFKMLREDIETFKEELRQNTREEILGFVNEIHEARMTRFNTDTTTTTEPSPSPSPSPHDDSSSDAEHEPPSSPPSQHDGAEEHEGISSDGGEGSEEEEKFSVRSYRSRWRYTSHRYSPGYGYRSKTYYGGPPVVIFLNLWSMPCGRTVRSSICTQYCCDPGRRSDSFCSSRLKCY